MRHEIFIQTQRLNHFFRAEEGRAHPAGIQSKLVGGEQGILGRGPERLNGHRGLVLLADGVRILVQVFEIQAEQYQHWRVEQTPPGAFETLLDDFLGLPVHLEVVAPLFPHRICESLFGSVFGDEGETPRLAAVR